MFYKIIAHEQTLLFAQINFTSTPSLSKGHLW